MTLFKEKQLIRIIETISRTLNFTDKKKEKYIIKYTKYDDYKEALDAIICDIYIKWYKKDITKCNYIMDMIIGTLPKYYSSKEEMILMMKEKDIIKV